MTGETRTRWIVALAAAVCVAVCVTIVVLALMTPAGMLVDPGGL
jgi:cytochrome c-type biogenesis protein CcmE